MLSKPASRTLIVLAAIGAAALLAKPLILDRDNKGSQSAAPPIDDTRIPIETPVLEHDRPDLIGEFGADAYPDGPVDQDRCAEGDANCP